MANLVPTPALSPVVQLETTDRNLAGPGGPLNLQAQALLNRTEFLRDVDSGLQDQIDALALGSANQLRSDLAAPGGASLSGFSSNGAGAAATTVYNVLQDYVSLPQFTTLATALATGKAVKIPATTTAIPLSLSDASAVLKGGARIYADAMTELQIASGVVTTTTGDIGNFGPSGNNLRIVGATPTTANLVSVASVTGSAGNYSVSLNLDSGAGVQVGNYLKLDNVIPLLTLSGDNSVFRRRVAPNELLRTSALLGTVTATTGGGSVSWASVSSGVLTDYVQTGDLVTIHGQTRQITGAVGVSSANIIGAWTLGVTSSRDYFVSRPNSGTIGTGGVSSSTVTGVGSAFLSEANPGDMLLCDGRFVAITAIANDLSMTVSPAVTLTAGSAYSVITAGVAHEGTHEVTAVAGNVVTVTNKWFGQFPPPINRVSGGDVKAIKTVLKNTGTGDGFSFTEGGALAWMNNIVLVGSSASSGTHGIALNGRSPEGPTQIGPTGTFSCGDSSAVTGWGRGAFLGFGCQMQARRTHFSGNVAFDIWALEGANVAIRECVISGGPGRGVQLNAGSTALITDVQVVGHGVDGLVALDGCTVYGEIPNFFGNSGMNVRVTGTAGFHVNEGVNAMAGLSGIFGTSAKADVSRVLFACNSRENIELSSGCDFVATEVTSSGSRGIGGTGRGLVLDDSIMVASGMSMVGNAGASVTSSGVSARLSAPNAFTRGTAGGGISAANMASILLTNGKPEAVAATVGSTVLIAGVSPAPTISGPARINEVANDGSLITDGAATAFGMAALKIGANSIPLTFFAKATQVNDFASIPSLGQATLDIAVTGALATTHTAAVNSNALPAGLLLFATIPSAGTVRVTAYNPTLAAIDPGNATYTVTVVG